MAATLNSLGQLKNVVHRSRLRSNLSPFLTNIIRRDKTTKDLPLPKLPESAAYALAQPTKGKIYDRKPFKWYCEEGKSYLWCSCGFSKTQPFCDSTHKNPHFKIKMKPIMFKCKESGEYWFCNCKQTAHRPFCDGTHRAEDIQLAVKV